MRCQNFAGKELYYINHSLKINMESINSIIVGKFSQSKPPTVNDSSFGVAARFSRRQSAMGRHLIPAQPREILYSRSCTGIATELPARSCSAQRIPPRSCSTTDLHHLAFLAAPSG